jgi:phosphocarrier protein
MTTVERRITVEHESGLHARPASAFVQTASKFDTDITIARADDGEPVDAASSLAVLSLGVEPGEEVVLSATGSEPEAAVERLVTLIENDFELDE